MLVVLWKRLFLQKRGCLRMRNYEETIWDFERNKIVMVQIQWTVLSLKCVYLIQ